MSYFDDLRTEFTQFAEARHNYWIEAATYANRFTNGFGVFLGAPKSFHPCGGHETNYVELCKIKNGEAIPETNIIEAITLTEDGFLSFAVRVYLERASNAYPKQPFAYHISFLPKDRSCILKVAGRSFEIDLADDARLPVYQTMLDGIRQWLSLKPWEFENQKAKIGFFEFDSKPS